MTTRMANRLTIKSKIIAIERRTLQIGRQPKPSSTRLSKEPFSSKTRVNKPRKCSACNSKWQRCRCRVLQEPVVLLLTMDNSNRAPSNTTRCIAAGDRQFIRKALLLKLQEPPLEKMTSKTSTSKWL